MDESDDLITSDSIRRIADYLEMMVPLLEKLVDATVATSKAQLEAMDMVRDQQEATQNAMGAGVRRV